ncbi:MAG: hypothetical protein JSU63_21615 [Phycisphaerales bacterium]|nr:MAG: hypothetical protein JSU63_21615 [Phycisphaerales bacterium]
MISSPRVCGPPSRLADWCVTGAVVWSCILLSGCLEPGPSSPGKEPAHPAAPSAKCEKAVIANEVPTRVEISTDTDDPNRWLVVEKVKGEASGAWATGSFDKERNKVSIRTKDVAQFSIDVSRIPIKWDKLVILSIDGKNSELMRRDYAVLHFVNDKYGWHVIEP